jgi:hypothetical protein
MVAVAAADALAGVAAQGLCAVRVNAFCGCRSLPEPPVVDIEERERHVVFRSAGGCTLLALSASARESRWRASRQSAT